MTLQDIVCPEFVNFVKRGLEIENNDRPLMMDILLAPCYCKERSLLGSQAGQLSGTSTSQESFLEVIFEGQVSLHCLIMAS